MCGWTRTLSHKRDHFPIQLHFPIQFLALPLETHSVTVSSSAAGAQTSSHLRLAATHRLRRDELLELEEPSWIHYDCMTGGKHRIGGQEVYWLDFKMGELV